MRFPRFFRSCTSRHVAKSLGCARSRTHHKISHYFRTASHIGQLWEICTSLESYVMGNGAPICATSWHYGKLIISFHGCVVLFDESIPGCTLWGDNFAPHRAFCPGGKQWENNCSHGIKDFKVTSDWTKIKTHRNLLQWQKTKFIHTPSVTRVLKSIRCLLTFVSVCFQWSGPGFSHLLHVFPM
jgi:hypothetical protein